MPPRKPWPALPAPASPPEKEYGQRQRKRPDPARKKRNLIRIAGSKKNGRGITDATSKSRGLIAVKITGSACFEHNGESRFHPCRSQSISHLFQLKRHQTDCFIHGAGHNRDHEQSQDDYSSEKRSPQPQKDHNDKTKGAVNNRRCAPENIKNQAGKISKTFARRYFWRARATGRLMTRLKNVAPAIR